VRKALRGLNAQPVSALRIYSRLLTVTLSLAGTWPLDEVRDELNSHLQIERLVSFDGRDVG
jgi:hypothetical protein